MQYIYTECFLPSNGQFYNIKSVHLRPKTVFDIKALLNNPAFMLKSEIDALQNCIDPRDSVNVYDLVNQDVVYLLYKLRSMSDDNFTLLINNEEYNVKISELDVKFLEPEDFNTDLELPDSKIKVVLAYQPIKNLFNLDNDVQKFKKDNPDFKGDIYNVVSLVNAIAMLDNFTNKDMIRNKMEQLSWKDSLYLIDAIEKFNKLDFGVKEEINIEINGDMVKVPIQITEEFFRPSL